LLKAIYSVRLPVEAFMNRGSYPYRLTHEDRLIISKWKWRVGIAYGAILLVLVLVMVANPGRERTEIAKSPADQGFSSASMAGKNRAR
jgi:hypothetical protein